MLKESLILIPMFAVGVVIYWYFWKLYKYSKYKSKKSHNKYKENIDLDSVVSVKTTEDIKSKESDNSYFFPWWVIMLTPLFSFCSAMSVASFDGNNETLFLYSGLLLALSSIPIIIVWAKNTKHKIAITILSFLSFEPVINLPVALIWAIYDAFYNSNPNLQIKFKNLISVLGGMFIIAIASIGGIYNNTFKPDNKYFEEFVVGCMNGDIGFNIKDKRGFCICSQEYVVKPIIKEIGIKEFERRYSKPPFLDLMVADTIEKCSFYI